jgi:hypothetical protein
MPLAALPLIATIATLASAIQNAILLHFPGWMKLGAAARRDRGPAAAGQRMLTGLALMASLGASLVPGGLLVLGVVMVQRAIDVPFFALELPALAVLGSLPIAGASTLVIWLAARAWDRLDPSQEMFDSEP